MSTQEPPVPGYDGMSVANIETRARAMDEQGVLELLDHERAHANRIQVVQMLEHRVEMLRSGQATPSGGDPGAPAPESVHESARATEQASPQTEGPPQNPPSQGVPTNPAQPRR